MDRSLTVNRWIYGFAYFGVTASILLVHILPIEVGPDGYPGPDLILCITFAWVLRRPQFLPTPLVALVILAGDMLFLRPPGLWTALVVLGLEFLRGREAVSREAPFPVEWGLVAGVMTAMTAAYLLILAVFGVEQAGFGLTLLQLAATILIYPPIVLFSRYVLGVRKMTPGELDEAGRPI
ncbi:MAG: rod shape-determining protein MreD [Rhodobacter sp.]|nr:rod shape-determining protein MreD [Rhodobacter sp.]